MAHRIQLHTAFTMQNYKHFISLRIYNWIERLTDTALLTVIITIIIIDDDVSGIEFKHIFALMKIK